MTLEAQSVAVSVPATCANLGPGYDSLGLALDWRDEYRARITEQPGVLVRVVGEGEDTVDRGAHNLVVRALLRGLAEMGESAPAGLELHCTNRIPHGRGLGSSSAAIVGGLGLARALVVEESRRLDDEALLALAIDIEGHPDNVAPAVLGGFCIGWVDESGGHAVRLDPHDSLMAVVAVPGTSLPTEAARGLMPQEVPMVDAVANLSRTALLVEAIARSPRLLLAATADAIHQDRREAAYPASIALMRALREAGFAAVISGAGPSVLVLTVEPAQTTAAVTAAAGTGWQVAPSVISDLGLSSL